MRLELTRVGLLVELANHLTGNNEKELEKEKKEDLLVVYFLYVYNERERGREALFLNNFNA